MLSSGFAPTMILFIAVEAGANQQELTEYVELPILQVLYGCNASLNNLFHMLQQVVGLFGYYIYIDEVLVIVIYQ